MKGYPLRLILFAAILPLLSSFRVTAAAIDADGSSTAETSIVDIGEDYAVYQTVTRGVDEDGKPTESISQSLSSGSGESDVMERVHFETDGAKRRCERYGLENPVSKSKRHANMAECGMEKWFSRN